jgi:SAM-dependent methyltransferase
MWEQSKAAKRRYNDGAFHGRYFVGHGVDIGGKPDPLGQYVGVFPRMLSVRTWDLEDGDAQLMKGVADGSFDFLHASHSLEHMRDVGEALENWTRVVKPGGFLVVTVPDEDLYELGEWPSRRNPDHKWTFTVCKKTSWSPRSLNVLDLAQRFADRLELERLVLLRDFFREQLAGQKIDQTLTPVAECAIEVIWRKRGGPPGRL